MNAQQEKGTAAENIPAACGDWFRTVQTDGGTLVGIKCYDDTVYYPLHPAHFRPKARAVLMDLDGTTATSEEFWIWIIEKTMQKLLGNAAFRLQAEDIPFVSGNTTAEHLDYCIKKYGGGKDCGEALALYHAITEEEMKRVLEGSANAGAFAPREGLKDFLLELKARGVKIGLATSGLDYKAIPEIVSVFRVIGLGDPLKFYDAVITGGRRKGKGDFGTVGELAAKPHPWIYSELGRLGLDCAPSEETDVIGIEDSAAGAVSLRLAGYPVIAFNDGNIAQSGLGGLCQFRADTFNDILKILF